MATKTAFQVVEFQSGAALSGRFFATRRDAVLAAPRLAARRQAWSVVAVSVPSSVILSSVVVRNATVVVAAQRGPAPIFTAGRKDATRAQAQRAEMRRFWIASQLDEQAGIARENGEPEVLPLIAALRAALMACGDAVEILDGWDQLGGYDLSSMLNNPGGRHPATKKVHLAAGVEPMIKSLVALMAA